MKRLALVTFILLASTATAHALPGMEWWELPGLDSIADWLGW